MEALAAAYLPHNSSDAAVLTKQRIRFLKGGVFLKKRSSNPFSMLSSLSDGYRLLLITSAVTTILSIVFNYLMPQIIRFAIDTVLGDQPSALPAVLTSILMPDKQDTMRNLIACAIMAMVFSVLS